MKSHAFLSNWDHLPFNQGAVPWLDNATKSHTFLSTIFLVAAVNSKQKVNMFYTEAVFTFWESLRNNFPMISS